MDKLVYDSPKQVDEKVQRLKKSFGTHKTIDVDYRVKQLKLLRAAVDKYDKEMNVANNTLKINITYNTKYCIIINYITSSRQFNFI